ncbi:MAG: hypothetical protein ABIG42_09070 [bacterium]
MDYVFLVLAIVFLVLAFILFGRSKLLVDEVKSLRDEISQLKNIGDLLSITESTLEEADKTITTAKRVMDKRISRMEQLLGEIDRKMPLIENRGYQGNSSAVNPSKISSGVNRQPVNENIDPDAEERTFIANRNREIILMLEKNIAVEDIARKTGASLNEINLIRKFVKSN